jgi:hypothetical protein
MEDTATLLGLPSPWLRAFVSKHTDQRSRCHLAATCSAAASMVLRCGRLHHTLHIQVGAVECTG